MVVLYCTSSSQPSNRLQSAVSLLQQLPLGLAPSHGHTHTHDHAAPTSSVTAGEVQLVCNLLQLFTAEAFGELLAHKPRTKAAKAAAPVISEAAEQLVLLTRFGADWPQDSLAAGIRQAAFGQLSADVYACLPVQQQMKAFLVRNPHVAIQTGLHHVHVLVVESTFLLISPSLLCVSSKPLQRTSVVNWYLSMIPRPCPCYICLMVSQQAEYRYYTCIVLMHVVLCSH